MNFLTILILSSFIVSSIKLKGVRALQEETDQLELLTHEEIRDLERQEKKDHDMIVNQAVDPGYRQHHEFVPRIKSGSEINGEIGRKDFQWRNSNGNSHVYSEGSSPANLKFQINPVMEKSFYPNKDSTDHAEESKQINIVVSASGLPDLSFLPMMRHKRNAEQMTRTDYNSPQYDTYQRHPQQQQQQQQKYQQSNIQHEHQDEHKFDHHVNSPREYYVAPVEENNREVDLRDFEPTSNAPRQSSDRTAGHDKRPQGDDEENRGPKYEFNYDIPKDSFQSDVINGQFSTFAKLPMSFESLIQSDASFLDSLSEQAPENIDRSIPRNYNNVPSTYSQPSQMKDSRNEQLSSLRSNNDDSDYESENFEPAQRHQPSQMEVSNPNQYNHRNQHNKPIEQYYPPERVSSQPQQKMIQLPATQPQARHVELPVYVNGGNGKPEGYEYANLKQHANQRPNLAQRQIMPTMKKPALRGLIRQASQAFRQPYQEFMERSSEDYPRPNALRPDQSSRFVHGNRRMDTNQYPNFASEQRVKDMMMMYYTTTTPPPPPPQKVVNAQLQVIKNGIPTLPALPKQLSINYISGPPPPPPPPKDPYAPMSYTTPPPPPPPPPPRPYYDRSRRPMYDKIMDQTWDKYTTTPPPPPSKIIQFGLNFSQTMDQPLFVEPPKGFVSIRNSKPRIERSVTGGQQEKKTSEQQSKLAAEENEDVCERSILNGKSNFCPSDPKYPKKLMLKAWDQEKIDQMVKQMNEKRLEAVNVGEDSRTVRNDSVTECQSFDQMMIPLKAKSTNGSWKVIVNLDNKLRQEIMISSCKTLDSSCSSKHSLIGSCGQSYQLKDLIIFDVESRSFQVDSFDVPSGCICLSQFSLQLW